MTSVKPDLKELIISIICNTSCMGYFKKLLTIVVINSFNIQSVTNVYVHCMLISFKIFILKLWKQSLVNNICRYSPGTYFPIMCSDSEIPMR